MTPTTQDEAILKKLGWIPMPDGPDWLPPNAMQSQLAPDLNDRQVIHDLWEKDAPDKYWNILYFVVNNLYIQPDTTNSFVTKREWINACKATTAQRKEAFCRLHGLETK